MRVGENRTLVRNPAGPAMYDFKDVAEHREEE
jgi:hypothetical protein